MNVTYNQIIADIKKFFDLHLQVNLFADMQYYDFNAGTNVYPATILVPQLSNINNTQLDLNFNLFFADLLNSDRSNTREVYSDMLDIARDFLSYFQDYEYDTRNWCITDTATIQPFEEKFDDAIVAGWVLNFTVELPFSKNICVIPLRSDN